jgi:anti-sigma regulatory factor (Ser/Thr protein kinase)
MLMSEPDPTSLPSSTPQAAHLLTRAFTRHQLGSLRHEVQTAATGHGVAGVALYRLIAAVNEVTTNAVRHGGGRGRLMLWWLGDRLVCRVVDTGPGLSAHQPLRLVRPAFDALNGRGLWLVRHSCGALAVDSGDTGTRVTISFPLDLAGTPDVHAGS